MKSPRLDDARLRQWPQTRTEPDRYTAAGLTRLLDLARGRGARTVTVGHGRTDPALTAARQIVAAWTATGGDVVDVVPWPERAASWLRPAARFTAGDPDLWVMIGHPVGWAQMARRLLWSTPWRPDRTLVLGDALSLAADILVGTHNVEGLTGTTAVGGAWTIRGGRLITLAGPQIRTRLRRARQDGV